MFLTFIGNAARASNIQNMTIKDMKKGTEDEEYEAICVRSCRYKTSLLYGEKKLLFGKDLFDQIKYYTENLRQLLCKDAKLEDHKRYLFTQSVEKMSRSPIRR